MNELPPWPHYADDEIAAVQRVLASGRVNYWTGDQGRQFEREFADYVGVAHGIALANGSVALEAALRAIDIGPGDEVIVTPRTFIASASSVVLCGAKPVFADIDHDSQNVTAATIAPLITERTRAIIAVHLAGWPCDMDPILALAKERGLRVVEDCAQAHGARYKGRPVGSFGDVAAFSFCQDKIMSTGGEGGMLVTDDKDIWAKAWSYKDHGKDFDGVHRPRQAGDEPFRWVHDSFGSNFRMTEMQAAIGRLQLRKLDGWVDQRRRNTAVLVSALQALSLLRIPQPDAVYHHACYKFYAFVQPQKLRPGWTRNRIIETLNTRGIPCFGGSCSEVYREKAFSDTGLAPAQRLPVAEQLGETSLMFPVHPTLQEPHMQRIADAICEVCTAATGSEG
jgi:dTDP-4-amino-4,6-dideoxygalactose transaminase